MLALVLPKVFNTVSFLTGWTAVPGAGARVHLQSAARLLSHPARLECSGGTFITNYKLLGKTRQAGFYEAGKPFMVELPICKNNYILFGSVLFFRIQSHLHYFAGFGSVPVSFSIKFKARLKLFS